MMANTSQTLDQLRQLIHKVESGRAQQSDINKFGMGMYQLNPISVTYQELKELKDNSQLQEFSFYIVEDYQLIHYKGRSNELNISEPEQLLFETLTSDTLKAEARSLTFPEDLVYFDFDGEVAPPSQVPKDDPNFKGYVYRRVDQFHNIDVAFDWRHATIRRWKMKDSDAKSLGMPVDTEDIDLYLLPKTLIYTGWKDFGIVDQTIFGNDATQVLNTFEAESDNDYVDEYFFFNRQTFNDTQNRIGKFGDINIDKCTQPEVDYSYTLFYDQENDKEAYLPKVGDGSQYYHIPNTIFKNRDGYHNEGNDPGDYGLLNVKIGGNVNACNTFSVESKLQCLNGAANNICLMKSYGDPFRDVGYAANNLIIARQGGFSGPGNGNNPIVENVTCISYLRNRHTVIGKIASSYFALVDEDDLTTIIRGDQSGRQEFYQNTFENIQNLTIKMVGVGATGNYFNHSTLRKPYSNVLNLHLTLENYQVGKDSDAWDMNLTKEKSSADIEKDVDQSTYTLSLPSETVGGKYSDFTSWYHETTTPESDIYGIYRFDDLDGDGTTNIILKKIDNPPQNFKFQLVPKSGITLTVTHDANSNGIRLKSGDQPDIALNGDTGDFAICEILNGNVTVVDYYQF
jgi:hypothetical protein